AAHWLWAIAQLLLLHNLIAGPAMVVTFLPLYITRVPREEQMLLKHFGRQYRDYMTRTGRLIPPLRM
ncbi:MAG: isoprenylcysteine carboxylmethyltransferase family protein, partial [Planctomycetota bacterium]